MQTTYIRFCQQYQEPVWGLHALPWIRTALVRVTHNRLRRAQFEWVGDATLRFDLDAVRKSYPLAMYDATPPMHCERIVTTEYTTKGDVR